MHASSETQGQSVGSGEKAGRKFSSRGKRAPGDRRSPNYFQKFKQMPAPDWAQKMLCIIVPIGEQFVLSSFREFVHDKYPSCTNSRKELRRNCSPIGHNNTKHFFAQSGAGILLNVWK